MARILVLGMALAFAGCHNAPYWEKHKREDAEIARQEALRAREHETWDSEERRRLLALCLDIAKFEKQWSNFAEWRFEPEGGRCTVSYKKTPGELKTRKQCADEMLSDPKERVGDEPSLTASDVTTFFYNQCTSENFSKTWYVRASKDRIR